MDLTGRLLRFAAGRPHVLIAELPGGTGPRLEVERFVRQRGWPVAASPADADVLVVSGKAGRRLEPFVDRLWRQVPAPRVRINVPRGSDVAEALQSARVQLRTEGEAMDTAGHDEGMEMPGGLPMADRGEDRDGLTLDRLHVSLGPLLPDWPAGLVVHTTLQGDVIQEARVEILCEDGQADDYWAEPGQPVDARLRTGRRLDSLARLLMVAGWPAMALRVRWLRDDVLAGAAVEAVMPWFRRLARQLQGSRTLRWLTVGLGALPRSAAESAGLTGPALRASESGGDVHARWQAWLSDVEETLPEVDETRHLRDDLPSDSPEPALALLPDLLGGAELGGARLIIASFDPDIAAAGSRIGGARD